MKQLRRMNPFAGGEKQVSIVTVEETGKNQRIVLDEEALKEVFNNTKLGDKPIMILSVSGAFRKGKSFLLCFLLRYLRNKGYRNENWIGNDALRDGFHWRGGRERDTTGIQIWNEPFFVRDSKGNEVAIFLMDTQGLFDHKSDTKLCTQIFAFSTLLSSVQVLNVMQNIQEDTLRHLQFFTGYAQASQEKRIPFQKLMFLIRDWQSPDENPFGLDEQGGYISSVMAISTQNSELVGVRNRLKSSFDNLQGFLLPYPGSKVAVTRKDRAFGGEIEDIDCEFLDYIRQLSDCLLSPQNLVPKMINGRMVTAKDMINYAISCSRKFESGFMPEPVSMMESATIALCLKALTAYTEEYVEEMKKTFKGDYMAEEDIIYSHYKITTILLKKFDEVVSFNDTASTEPYREKLEKNFVERLEFVKRSNELEQKFSESKMWGNISDRVMEYKENMSKANNFSEVKAYHDKFVQESIRLYTNSYEAQPNFENAKRTLSSSLNLEYRKLERESVRKQESIRIKEMSSNSEKNLHALTEEFLKEYQLKFRKCQGKFALSKTLQNIHSKFVKDVQKKFESESEMRNITDENLIKKHCDDLLTCLNEEFSITDSQNMEMEKNVRKLQETAVEELQSKYIAIMNEGMKESYVLPKVLEESHQKVVEMMLKSFHEREEIKGKCYKEALFDEYSAKLKEVLDGEYDKLCKTNEANKEIFQQTIKSTDSFFNTVGWIIAVLLGTPIALAFGLPVLLVYGVYKGIAGFCKWFAKKMKT